MPLRFQPLSLVLLGTFTLCAPAAAQEMQLLWGDTHLHTSWSVDAFSMGNQLADPDTAYRYAKGEPVLHPRLGTRIRIDRPLDFLVVADHAENLRWQINTLEGIELLRGVEGFDAALALVRDNPGQTFMLGRSRLEPAYDAAIASPEVRRYTWALQVDTATRHNEPGTFTALTGWEGSSNGGGSNLHRVVFSPSDGEVLKRFIPYSNAESLDPEDLWNWLDATAANTGAEFVAIPHNSNLSAGYMFAETRLDGSAPDRAWAEQRARLEPVMEITQVKGTSETHPALSPNDEQASYEIYEKLLGGGQFRPLRADYARTALMSGLELEAKLGANPYRLGFIGSSDSHVGFSSIAENDFYGKAVSDTLPAERLNRTRANFNAWEMSASGLAAVWAEDNTRNAITAAFKRREVYATSGPRILLRVTGTLAAGSDAPGVPMGGELTAAPAGRAPSLRIEAAMDPYGARLERLQVIKGWHDGGSSAQEQVFDVTLSESAQGSARLDANWTDPAFDPAQPAFYYVRVLEIPTPRHSTYDAVALGIDVTATGMPEVIRERAWSSPIWYRPGR
jgi:hypothetical protein